MHIPMPDVTVVGGIGELKKIGDMLHAWGLPTAPHGPFGSGCDRGWCACDGFFAWISHSGIRMGRDSLAKRSDHSRRGNCEWTHSHQ